ncbi:MAG: hypothetical protein ISR64_07590 [Deltaproteobacteria bacterium]|nr:hypothetical protein [Deltaproteobacteria bacterium]
MSHCVLIADNLAPVASGVLTDAGFTVSTRHGLDEDQMVDAVKGYHGVLVRSAVKMTSRIIEAGDSLKVIGRAGIGVDNIDLSAAAQNDVVVLNVPGGNSITAAEHTLALMFALARNIPAAVASLSSGRWERQAFAGRELTGLTLGIVGFGNVGRIVADRALGLKMRITAFDPNVPAFAMEGLGVRPARSLDELLSVSDMITVHTPLSDETRGLIGKKALATMKMGVMLVNVSRGGVVDEDALYDALKSGHVSAAALDVFQKEPPVDSPLLTLPNVVATPHLGASTKEAQTRVAVSIAEQVRDFLLHGRKYGEVTA